MKETKQKWGTDLKQLIIVLAGICTLILLIPTLLVLPFTGTGAIKTEKHAQQHEEKRKSP